MAKWLNCSGATLANGTQTDLETRLEHVGTFGFFTGNKRRRFREEGKEGNVFRDIPSDASYDLEAIFGSTHLFYETTIFGQPNLSVSNTEGRRVDFELKDKGSYQIRDINGKKMLFVETSEDKVSVNRELGGYNFYDSVGDNITLNGKEYFLAKKGETWSLVDDNLQSLERKLPIREIGGVLTIGGTDYVAVNTGDEKKAKWNLITNSGEMSDESFLRNLNLRERPTFNDGTKERSGRPIIRISANERPDLQPARVDVGAHEYVIGKTEAGLNITYVRDDDKNILFFGVETRDDSSAEKKLYLHPGSEKRSLDLLLNDEMGVLQDHGLFIVRDRNGEDEQVKVKKSSFGDTYNLVVEGEVVFGYIGFKSQYYGMERGDKTLFPSAVSLEGRVYLPIRKEKFLDGSGSWQFICKDGRQLVFYGVVSETIGDKEELRLMELCDFETRAGDSPGQPKGENHGDTKIVTGISPYLSYENKQLKGQFI